LFLAERGLGNPSHWCLIPEMAYCYVEWDPEEGNGKEEETP